jgi:mxaL protein
VPHASRFGLPEDPSKVEGYIPRNGPWGTAKAVGTEHLSSLKQDYLMDLAQQNHMLYHHLENNRDMAKALQNTDFAYEATQPTEFNKIAAALALLLLIYCYQPFRPKWPLRN